MELQCLILPNFYRDDQKITTKKKIYQKKKYRKKQNQKKKQKKKPGVCRDFFNCKF